MALLEVKNIYKSFGGVDAIPQAAVGAGAATSSEAATPPAESAPSTESTGSESGAAQIPTK